MATHFNEVIDSFHSIIMDKREIPEALELMWLKKAVSELSVKTSPIEYNEELDGFNSDIGQYVIDTLALLMKSYYVSREISKNNKIASIVGKDISINGSNGIQKYTKEEYDTIKIEISEMIANLTNPDIN
jgi:hypothetical protein